MKVNFRYGMATPAERKEGHIDAIVINSVSRGCCQGDCYKAPSPELNGYFPAAEAGRTGYGSVSCGLVDIVPGLA